MKRATQAPNIHGLLFIFSHSNRRRVARFRIREKQKLSDLSGRAIRETLRLFASRLRKPQPVTVELNHMKAAYAGHERIDQRSIALHRAIGEKLAANPELLEVARDTLAR